MNFRTEISIEGSGLDIGETVRVLCPQCRGGTSEEKSLSISRDDKGLLWNCFRAKCQLTGGTGDASVGTPAIAGKPTVTPKPKRKEFTGKTEKLNEEQTQRIQNLWGITEPSHWYWTDAYGGRVAMSVRSPKYTHRGWVLRDIYNKHAVKAINFLDEDEEGLSWYKTSPHVGTVLVEDIPSAVRASAHINACALLGTGIGTPRAMEIMDHATRPIVVALDQDATDLSFKWANKWALFWGDVRVGVLKKDIKDMEEQELREWLHEAMPDLF